MVFSSDLDDAVPMFGVQTSGSLQECVCKKRALDSERVVGRKTADGDPPGIYTAAIKTGRDKMMAKDGLQDDKVYREYGNDNNNK